MTEDRERAEFEKWVRAKHPEWNDETFLKKHGIYFYGDVREWWELWEAARCEERKRTLKECAQLAHVCEGSEFAEREILKLLEKED